MRTYTKTALMIVTILLHSSIAMAALTVTPTQNEALLTSTLIGEGLTIVSESFSYKGNPTAAGTFSGGWGTGLDIESGVFVRTGSAESGNVAGANVLEFDITSETQMMSCEYVLATEEYGDSGMPVYPDILKFYVDGRQIAVLPGTATPVSMKQLAEQNSPDWHDNRHNEFAELEYTGFTSVLTATAEDLSAGSHHVKILVMNEGDLQKHSAILIKAGSCRATAGNTIPPEPEPIPPAPVPEPSTYALLIVGLLGLGWLKMRRK